MSMDLANGIKEYNLKTPIGVHIDKEGEREVHLLTLHEPKRCHMRYSTKMSQQITRAMFEANENDKDKDKDKDKEIPEEPKPFHERTNEEHEKICKEFKQGISIALHASEKVDLAAFIDNFIKMATVQKKNIVLCDDQVPIKEVHFDEMAAETIMDIAFTYASFFLMPSVISGT